MRSLPAIRPTHRLFACLSLLLASGCATAGPQRRTEWTLVDARQPEQLASASRCVDGAHDPVVDAAARGLDGQCALVIVDGFDNSRHEADANFDRIAAAYAGAGGACRLFGFIWRSQVGLFHFADAEREADRAAATDLARFLEALAVRSPTSRLHVAAHSLAARVALQALLRDDAPAIDSLILLAPAVPADVFEPTGEFRASAARARLVEVYVNTQDHVVLGLLYPFASRRFSLSLGHVGARRPRLLPPNVRQFDLAERLGPSHSAIEGYQRDLWRNHLALAAQATPPPPTDPPPISNPLAPPKSPRLPSAPSPLPPTPLPRRGASGCASASVRARSPQRGDASAL